MKKLISLVLAAAMMLGAGSAVTAKAEEELRQEAQQAERGNLNG